ncbi:hypothetical protein QQG91_15305 (plasmid) [Marivivens sp. LCG002]|uniref:hypothetical protein n=1 Tax=Marivivens sp. LCG002 TaxID=3051171 RepID=UPI0025575A2E|nr:hypothetical protein [Marivivens sp. LCG002]WIV52349.1 hypothetical protein QQG91_15305 [Marivivens sp. LCG002]
MSLMIRWIFCIVLSTATMFGGQAAHAMMSGAQTADVHVDTHADHAHDASDKTHHSGSADGSSCCNSVACGASFISVECALVQIDTVSDTHYFLMANTVPEGLDVIAPERPPRA